MTMLLYIDSQKNDSDSNEDNKATQAGKGTGEKYRNYIIVTCMTFT